MIDIQQDATPTKIGSLFERSILDAGIPPCPAILNHFTVESNKDEPDYHHLAIIIGTDVSLSAALIKTANSPYFGARQRVRSVNEALAILGLNTASRAIAGISLSTRATSGAFLGCIGTPRTPFRMADAISQHP